MRIPLLALIPPLLLTAPGFAQEPDAETFYKTYCVACHNIGSAGPVGPDLAGVTERQTREWLIPFMMDPPAVLNSGDPYAQELLAANNNIPMAKIPGLDQAMAIALLDYIEAQSGSAPIAPDVKEVEPFTAEETQGGRDLFTGAIGFENGAPACVSCHTTADLGGWGGGTLGPDLTNAFERLNGRRALTGWLGMPASAVMTPVFKDHKLTKNEIRDLVAFLESEHNSGNPEAPSVRASFFGAGVFVALVLLALFGFFWKNRYRDTRTLMVEKAKR